MEDRRWLGCGLGNKRQHLRRRFDAFLFGFGEFGLAQRQASLGFQDFQFGAFAGLKTRFIVPHQSFSQEGGLAKEAYLLLGEEKVPIGCFGSGDDQHHLVPVLLKRHVRGKRGEADVGQGG